MNLKHACIFILFVLLYSCSGKQQQLTQITNLEKSLYGNTKTEFNRNEAMSLVTAYYEFAKDYPEDEHSSSFLFNAGEVAMGLMKSKKAIEYFQLVYKDYPEYDKASTAMFLEGFVYETQLNNLSMAQKIYLDFLKKYPDHSLANDAQFSLNNLGKSDEEIIKEFEKKIQEQEENKTAAQ
jgi:TolA-binding protein